jgi:hypothetical protein
MGAPIDYALQLKRKEYIALLDQAIAIAEQLGKEMDCIDQILREKFPVKLAA